MADPNLIRDNDLLSNKTENISDVEDQQVKDIVDAVKNDKEETMNFCRDLTEAMCNLGSNAKAELGKAANDIFEKYKDNPSFQTIMDLMANIASLLGFQNFKNSFIGETKNTVENSDNMEKSEVDKESVKWPEFPLFGKLESINEGEDGKREDKLYSSLKRNRPEEGEEPEQELRLYEAVGNISGQISRIENLLNDEKLNYNEDLKDTKIALENMQNVINNTTRENVNILQQYIYNNLEDEELKNEFKEKNHMKENGDFDGQFGISTLAGLNIMLNKTGKYIDDMENKLNQVKEEEKKQSSGSDKSESGTPSSEDLKAPETSETSVEELSQNSEPLKMNDGDHQLLSVGGGPEGSRFYCLEPGEQKFENKENLEDFECYMKYNGELYKVKFDNKGCLCPVTTLIDNNGAKRNVLIGNNRSCIQYLQNKLPDSIKDKCVIWWSKEEQNYKLTSIEANNIKVNKSLTIEPMTIAGNREVSSNLSKSLAFIHLANCLRSGAISRGVEDVDVNRKLKLKGVKDSEGDKITINRKYYGLDDATPGELAAFKRYNNPEGRHNKQGNNEKNQYERISFPSITLNLGSIQLVQSKGGMDGGEPDSESDENDSESQVSEEIAENDGGVGKEDGEVNDNLSALNFGDLNFSDFDGSNTVDGIPLLGDGKQGFGYKKFYDRVVIGDRNEDGKINKGKVLLNDGNKYEGGLKKVHDESLNEEKIIMDGEGKLQYKNGSQYEGSFKDDIISDGVLNFNDGQDDIGVFEGTFNVGTGMNEGNFTSDKFSAYIKDGQVYTPSDKKTFFPLLAIGNNGFDQAKKLHGIGQLLENARDVSYNSISNKIIIKYDNATEYTFNPKKEEKRPIGKTLYDRMSEYINSKR